VPPDAATSPDPGAAWLARLAGRFIVFDGPDGSGKSTQLARFADECRAHAVPLCPVRDPGGTGVGERIREVLLSRDNEGMSLRCEMLLYMASRAELVARHIRPALDARRLVLADRFVSSTFAYQGAAGGLPPAEIRAAAQVATGGLWPDLTVIFDVDTQTAAARMTGKKSASRGDPTLSLFADRMEAKGESFHARVRQGFLDQAAADPDHYVVIDAARGADEVWTDLLARLAERTAAAHE